MEVEEEVAEEEVAEEEVAEWFVGGFVSSAVHSFECGRSTTVNNIIIILIIIIIIDYDTSGNNSKRQTATGKKVTVEGRGWDEKKKRRCR